MVSEFCPLLVHGEMTGSCSFTEARVGAVLTERQKSFDTLVSYAPKLHDPSPFMTPKNERRGASWNKGRIGEELDAQNGRRQHGK
ncbi:hypothetical protein CUMW_157750 [Citrus unshiu]|nr:hypothetical protein CUMW_157750 [Citrus unshiu]